jgi:UDP-glucose 4-epimerase
MVKDCELIFHLAANPEVKLGVTNPQVHFAENILTTFNLLEAIRRSRKPKTVVFTSTSTVYGECSQIPTAENYGPLIPISTYGASKLSCEALISSYAHTFNHRALIVRLANIIGPRSKHGVVVDFMKKTLANPNELEILGDGYQEKSYLHIIDCIDAIMHLCEKFNEDTERIDIYNVGSSDTISVREIARITSTAMNVPNIKYKFTGGVDGGRGWKGDVKKMQLSIEKLRKTGWTPRYTSRQAVRLTAKALLGTSIK